jgi:hypothetical protein
MYAVERESMAANNLSIIIKTRDMRLIQFTFEKENEYYGVFKLLSTLTQVESIDTLFAFEFKKIERKHRESPNFNQWRCYDPVAEYQRMGISNDPKNPSGWYLYNYSIIF